MEAIITVLLAAVAAYLAVRLLTAPIRWLWKILINLACGALMLTLVNLLAPYTGFFIEITMLRAFIVGVLGLPGFILVALWALLL